MEVAPTLQLTTTKLANYIRLYAHRCLDARLVSRDVAAMFIDKTTYQTAFNFRLLQLTNQQRAAACLHQLIDSLAGQRRHGLRWRIAQFRADD